jgi:hypothetical protein
MKALPQSPPSTLSCQVLAGDAPVTPRRPCTRPCGEPAGPPTTRHGAARASPSTQDRHSRTLSVLPHRGTVGQVVNAAGSRSRLRTSSRSRPHPPRRITAPDRK